MKFTLNDERVTNSYGFRVLTSGIKLDRFLDNPVCLNNHRNDTKDVLGVWSEVNKEEHTLTATPVFDTEDPDGKEVVRKVEKGILKACSIGINFDPEDIVMMDDILTVTQCELMEVSICAVPANAAAITLYNKAGEILTESEVKKICLNAQTAKPFEPKHMKQVTTYLQLADNATEGAILEAIKGIESKLTASENENATLKQTIESLKKAEQERQAAVLSAEIDTAVKDGRLDEAGKAPILEMEFNSAMALLKALPKRKGVAEKINTPEGELSKYDKLSWEDLDKGNHLAYLKANHSDYYAERFEQKFGRKPKN